MRVGRIAGWAMALIIGAVYGTAATIAHAFRLGFFPLGLLLALIGTAALLVALRLLTGDRWATLSAGLGMVVATLVFSSVGPGGSAVVAAATPDTEWIAVTWSVSVPLLVALVVAWPDLSRLSGPRRLGE